MDTKPAARPAHGDFPGHDPLARFGDRVEDVVAVASLAVTLLGLPVAAVIGSEAHVRAALSEQRVRPRQRTATAPSEDPLVPAPLTAEGVVVGVVAVVTGAGLALGGAAALCCVLVRSARHRLRPHRRHVEREAVEPQWRRSA
ncbi:hypothetical protein ACFFSW_31485 [Saccharothrix longispora]|uniref:Uncharacterized protein n=1 Tax=Saccharothrix longispora TaxID=33920 RepID=A0ABU1PPQ1_9PSEU|nr:hypothetical protein [Saccharothrix longispora]MDR6592630.1 hypothetical protein [Saccharothrix longispora]